MRKQFNHSHIKHNENVVEIGAVTIFFSYKDAVAFHVSGQPLKYIEVSTTTSRHITKFKQEYLNIKNSELIDDHEQFDAMLKQAIKEELK